MIKLRIRKYLVIPNQIQIKIINAKLIINKPIISYFACFVVLLFDLYVCYPFLFFYLNLCNLCYT